MEKYFINGSIENLITELNRVVAQLEGRKFRSANEYHSLIKEIVTPVLNEVPDVSCTTWQIQFNYDLVTYESTARIASYTKEFIQDKRTSDFRGTFGRIFFHKNEVLFGTDSLSDAPLILDIVNVEDRVRNAYGHVSYLKNEVSKAIEYAEQQDSILAELKAKQPLMEKVKQFSEAS